MIALDPETTATKAWAELNRVFAAAKLETPVIDARLLVCHTLGLDRMGLLKEPNRPLGAKAADLIDAARRRLANEPVSRIIGERAFWGRTFKVTPATLDPRHDSETLVETVLALLKEAPSDKPLRILDLGTGTGCLLLTLLAEVPDATGLGIDISPEAIIVAKANAARLGLAERARFQPGNWAAGLTKSFDVIVSNPPYIRHGDLAALPADVAAYDPVSALDGGPDGLAAYRQILASLPPLSPRARLVFELGAGQASSVAQLIQGRFATTAILTIRRWHDLAGIERVVSATFDGQPQFAAP